MREAAAGLPTGGADTVRTTVECDGDRVLLSSDCFAAGDDCACVGLVGGWPSALFPTATKPGGIAAKNNSHDRKL